MYQKKTLPNGLSYILAPMPSVKSITALVMLKAGSRYEGVENNGVSHFLEHMMFKGTKRRPSKKDISTLLDGIGANFNAFTSKEYTGFYVKAAAEHQGLILDVLSDMVLNSVFAEGEVARERGVIIEEINMGEDDPAGKAFELFEDILFSGSPLAYKITGEVRNIEGMTREKVVEYVDKMYHANSMVVTLAGQLEGNKDESASCEELLSKYFGLVKGGNENKFDKFKPGKQSKRVSAKFKETEQSHFCLGVRGYSLSHKDRFVASVLASILGGNMSSRLFEEVREKRGLAYYVSAFAEEYLDTGFVMANAGVRLAQTEEAIKVILEQFELLSAKEVAEEELIRAKDNYKGKMILALEDSSRVASFFAGQEILEGKIKMPEDILARIDAVSREDIKRVAQELFKRENFYLSIVGPFKDEGRFDKIIE